MEWIHKQRHTVRGYICLGVWKVKATYMSTMQKKLADENEAKQVQNTDNDFLLHTVYTFDTHFRRK